MIFCCCLFLPININNGSHLKTLMKAIQISIHNVCFYANLTKDSPNYYIILPLIWSAGVYKQHSL